MSDPDKRRARREALWAKIRLHQLVKDNADEETVREQALLLKELLGRAEQERLAQAERDEPPPFLGTWGRVYALVIVYLGLVIAALYGMTWAFAA